jgi:hypothetical protein
MKNLRAINNFIDIVVEDIDNEIMNDDVAMRYFDKGGKLVLTITKDGTDVSSE